MSTKLRVKIYKNGFIPGIGNGPILNPISITSEMYERLKKLGYKMEVMNTNINLENIQKEFKKIIETKEVENKIVEEVKEIITDSLEKINEVKEVEKITPVYEEQEIKEEIINEETDDTNLNNPDLLADAIYDRDFLKSKNICKTILNNRKVQYEESSSLGALQKKVLGSNPEN